MFYYTNFKALRYSMQTSLLRILIFNHIFVFDELTEDFVSLNNKGTGGYIVDSTEQKSIKVSVSIQYCK